VYLPIAEASRKNKHRTKVFSMEGRSKMTTPPRTQFLVVVTCLFLARIVAAFRLPDPSAAAGAKAHWAGNCPSKRISSSSTALAGSPYVEAKVRYGFKKLLVPNTLEPPPRPEDFAPSTAATTATTATSTSTTTGTTTTTLQSVAASPPPPPPPPVPQLPEPVTTSKVAGDLVDDSAVSATTSRNLFEAMRDRLPVAVQPHNVPRIADNLPVVVDTNTRQTAAVTTRSTAATITTTTTSPPLNVHEVVEQMQASHQDFLRKIHDAPRAPGAAPLLSDYILQGKMSVRGILDRLEHLPSLAPNTDAWASYFSSDKHSLLLFGRGGGAAAATEKLVQALQSIPVERLTLNVQNFLSKGLVTQDALDALDWNEFGGWYAGGIAVLVAISLGGIEMSTAKDPEAAALTVEEATSLSPEKPSLLQEAELEKEKLEAQVRQLTEATTNVSKELMQLKQDKATRDYSVAEMKSELRQLQNNLSSQQLAEVELRSQLQRAESKFEAETATLKEQLAVKEKSEAELRQKVNELETMLGNASNQLAATQKEHKEQLSEANKQIETLLAEKAALQTQLDEMIKSRSQMPKKEPAVTKPSVIKSSLDELPVAGAAKPKAATSSREKAIKVEHDEVTEETTPTPDDQDKASFFASIEEPPVSVEPMEPLESLKMRGMAAKDAASAKKKASKTGKSKTTAKASKAKATTKPPAAPSTVDGDDWIKLSASALKRKKVNELMDYLTSKGISAIGEDGKPLKKDMLVEAIQSISV